MACGSLCAPPGREFLFCKFKAIGCKPPTVGVNINQREDSCRKSSLLSLILWHAGQESQLS